MGLLDPTCKEFLNRLSMKQYFVSNSVVSGALVPQDSRVYMKGYMENRRESVSMPTVFKIQSSGPFVFPPS